MNLGRLSNTGLMSGLKSILLVDDHKMIRDAVKQYLKGSKDFSIAAEAENGIQALERMNDQSFDIVLTDLSMPKLNGLELGKKIKASSPEQKVIALSMDFDTATIKKLFDFGFAGYMFKSISQKELIQALRIVAEGGTYPSR